MKKGTIVVIAIACICLICGGFYFSTVYNSGEKEKELTEIEKLIVKDLEHDYPKTPREVIKLYNRIVKAYHNKETTSEQLEDLVEQMMCLFDEELLLVNDKETYYASVVAQVEDYAKRGRVIADAQVCSGRDVEYDEDETKNDEIAYVTATYVTREKTNVETTNQMFVLRKDAAGDWKLITFYLIEGEDSDDE